MILNLLVLVMSAVVWIAALWPALLSGVAGWPDGAVAAVHVAPPVGATLIWMFRRRRLQQKRASEAQMREERVEAERTAAREAAKKAYADEIRHRRFGCDGRMVVCSRLGLTATMPLLEPGHPNVDIRPIELDARRRYGSLLEELGPALEDALRSVFSACRAAIALPIFVSPPAELSGEEVLAYLRAVQSAMADEFAPEMNRPEILAPILFLPAGDSVPGSILSLFESAPDMPGALILAFDSPYARLAADDDAFDEEPDEDRMARERLLGRPSEAVVAVLMTSTELNSMLAAISSTTGSGVPDSMTPFWEKAVQAGGALEALSLTAPELRSELADSPVLGRVHRASVGHPGKRSGVRELARIFQDVLEQAQINSGLIDPPFSFNETPAETDGQKSRDASATCSAIVHNAGSVEVAGKRLAALGSALYTFNIELNPIDQDAVFNVVTRMGDLGRASGVGQLALTLSYAAQNAAPALYAEFKANDSIAASFVMPA